MEPILFLSFVISFFITLFATPYWINRAKKVGLIGKDMNKYDKPKIAEIGGIPVVLGFIFGVLFYIAVKTFYINFDDTNTFIMAGLATILLITLIGLIDDILGWKLGLRQYQKPLLTLIAALPIMVINAGQSKMIVPFLGQVDIGFFYPLFIIPLAIVGASNGFNMLAGYNGLEAGMGSIILTVLAYVAWQNDLGWIAVLALCMVFSLLAFLIFNKYPSKIFPGDTLTYSVGALIAIVAILGNMERIALILFIPYFVEFFLKLKGFMQKESFAKPLPDKSLKLRYDKIYSLTHLMIKILTKIKKKVYEKDVVYSIWLIEIVIAVIVLLF